MSSLVNTNPEQLPSSIITETLNENQWESLSNLYEDFFSEYSVRRELLLTRLDVTIQSFKWGESSKVINYIFVHFHFVADQFLLFSSLYSLKLEVLRNVNVEFYITSV